MFQWSSHQINLDGHTLTNTGSLTFTVQGSNLFGFDGVNHLGGTLDNQGTILQPSGSFYMYDSVAIKNEGTFNLTGDASINFGNLSPSITNTNTGIFEKTDGTGTSTIGVPVVNQGGVINAASGTLNLIGGTSSTNGNFNAQSPGTLGLGGAMAGTYFGAGTGAVTIVNAIQIQPAGATLDFAAGLFRWTGNDINLDGNTLTNTGLR